MEKITSFTIDHIKLQPGVYVSRKDKAGDSVITTFDIRMTSPNEEPVMNTAELHTIEHLAATFLRNHPVFGPKMIYWGPMGCRTGNYLLLNGDYESRDIVSLMIETFEFIRDFEGEVPGASARDCGNYLDMNLGMAKYLAKKYLDEQKIPYAIYTAADSNEIQAVVTKAVADCNAMYIPTDNTFANNMEIVKNIAVPARVPTVTGAEAMCEVGALATLSISYYDLGAKAAEMAYDILVNGKKPAEMPIEYLTDGLVPKYNADIAEALGVTIPEGMEPVA